MIRSYPALTLGGLFALGTGYVLFHDVHSLEQITIDHVMTFLVLVGTIAAGHHFWPQLKACRLLASLGLATLFVAGTGYCLVSSAGRQGASQHALAAVTESDNNARADVERDLAAAKTRLAQAMDEEATNCASGKGKRCLGTRSTREERQTYVNVLTQQLKIMDPHHEELPELRHAAKVFAALPMVTASEDHIFAQLVLFTPVMKAVFLELATLVFLGIALGHRATAGATSQGALPVTRLVSHPVARIPSQLALPAPRDPVEQLMIDALGKASRPLSNEELAATIGVTPGAASKIRARIGDRVRVERNGRELAISLAVRS